MTKQKKQWYLQSENVWQRDVLGGKWILSLEEDHGDIFDWQVYYVSSDGSTALCETGNSCGFLSDAQKDAQQALWDILRHRPELKDELA